MSYYLRGTELDFLFLAADLELLTLFLTPHS
jgi:hypothetical protein